MRVCPTPEGSVAAPLITHRVTGSDCLARQSCNYHKCHRCIYRGQSAEWQPGDGVASTAPSTNGVHHNGSTNGVSHDLDKPVEVPRPAQTPAETNPAVRRQTQPSPV